MTTLICGSVAFDNIMVFGDRFRNHILPDQIHILNVSFLVPEMRREFGGCAANIAYSLHLLGGNPTIMATVGADAQPYFERWQTLGLRTDGVRVVEETLTAQAFITTDLDDNQITAFHPGAMNFSHLNHVADVPDATLGIVGPDGRDGMLQHARELAAAGIPFIFDPGQGMPMFSGEDLLQFIEQATYCAVNSYEAQMLTEKTGQSLAELAARLEALIITHGAEGSEILAGSERYRIPCVPADAVVDPTGCGDAFRAGLLYGIANGWDWQRTGQLAAVMGAIKISHRGGQNHAPSRDDIAARYQAAFGESPW